MGILNFKAEFKPKEFFLLIRGKLLNNSVVNLSKDGTENVLRGVRDPVREDDAVNLRDAGGPFVTLTEGATTTWDWSGDGKSVILNLTGNRSLQITNATGGRVGIIRFNQDITGGRTITLLGGNHVVVNAGAGALSLTADPSATDLAAVIYDDVADEFVWVLGLNAT